MLSVGIVAAGGIAYYMESVGSGFDDYYARAEPGRWCGSGSNLLDLDSEVRSAQVDALAAGQNPGTGERLGVRVGKVVAFDLTFSAPKSVSILAELSESPTRQETLRAHQAAVDATLRFIESEGVLVGRRGLGGARQVLTHGAVAAAFDHHTSRAGDPQLHTHLLVFNRAQGIDGRWAGLHGRRLFAWAKTAGYVYQAALRAELTERIGVSWKAPVNGMAEIKGIPDSVLEEFSTRRAAIETVLAEKGFSTARAAQVATLASRPNKGADLDPDIQRSTWRDRAHQAGLSHESLTLPDRQQPDMPEPRHLVGLSGELAAADGLTANRSYFDRRDVLRAIAESTPAGSRPDEIRNLATKILTDDRFVELGTEHPLAGQLYTTGEILALEAQLLEAAERAAGSGSGLCSVDQVESAIGDRRSLSPEQQNMVRRLCTSPDGVLVVIGRAGTGKTFALDSCRQAWTASGVTVIGAALPARTAVALQAGTGIPSTTVDRILTDLARPGPEPVLPRNGVLVIDEAGMVGTRKLAALVQAAERTRTKVVLVGDPRQLPEVEAGGAFAALAQRGAVELTENRRQANGWEREALAQLRHGDVADAVAVFREHGRITMTATAEEARSRLVADWWSQHDPNNPDRTVMIALHRVDVDDLNMRARSHLQAHGYLSGLELEVANKRSFTAGDEVITLLNDRRLGITNGTRGHVTRLDTDTRSITIETRDGRTVTLPSDYIDAGHLSHGYALTAHKAQGITVEHAYILGSDRLYREAGYTTLSRAVHRSDLYHVAPPQIAWQPAVDPLAALTTALTRSGAQTLATDHALDPHAPGASHLVNVRDVALADPGQHLLDRIGPPPPAGREREMWAAAATAIDAYRDRYHITDPDGLGPPPDPAYEPERARGYEHAQALAQQVERHLELVIENGLDLNH